MPRNNGSNNETKFNFPLKKTVTYACTQLQRPNGIIYQLPSVVRRDEEEEERRGRRCGNMFFENVREAGPNVERQKKLFYTFYVNDLYTILCGRFDGNAFFLDLKCSRDPRF